MIGARPPLIAFNVNLRSTDLARAQSIAKAIRQSSGGIPHLKAIGVELAVITSYSIHYTKLYDRSNHRSVPFRSAPTVLNSDAGDKQLYLA